jgi:hypothetical protein
MRIPQHGDDHIACSAHVLARLTNFGAGGCQFFDGLRQNVINHQFITRFQQIFRHRLAHDAQSDKSNFFHVHRSFA